MKKCIPLFLAGVSCLIFVPKQTNASENVEYYITSQGEKFSLSNTNVSFSDLENKIFSTSQEVIDYIYEVSSSKTMIIDDYYSQKTIFGYKLTNDEIKLLISHPAYVDDIFDAHDEALTTTQYLYENNCADDSIGNAFLHSYWTMYMMHVTDSDFGYLFAKAHENYSDNEEFSCYMDLYNDKVAYDYYAENNFESVKDKYILIDSCVKLVSNGNLIYVLRNYSYLSEIIHYLGSNTDKEIYSIGDFFAYTNSSIPYELPETKYTIVSRPGGPSVL